MSLEMINTLGTLLTTAIVGATAIAALVQLRHLRTGNQIHAQLSVGDRLRSPAVRDAMTTVGQYFENALDDPTFREYVASYQRGAPVNDVNHRYVDLHEAARVVGNTYEELGVLVKNGIVDERLLMDRLRFLILRDWGHLKNGLAFIRAVVGTNAIWENFEYLAVLSEDYARQFPTAYPKSFRRFPLVNPWPVPPLPANA